MSSAGSAGFQPAFGSETAGWKPPLRVVLASTSVSRRAILQAAGLDFDAVSPGVDEDAVKLSCLASGAPPRRIAVVLADQKALAVSRSMPGLVIGADQTLDLDGALYDKPRDLAQARQTLAALRGKTHHLHSAIAAARDGAVVWRACQTASLTMWTFDDVFLDAYLTDQGEAVLSSVGAYLLEGRGIQLFDKIEGDYFSILGLPLLPLLAFLRSRAE